MRRQTRHRRGEHLTEDFSLRAGQAFADALDGLAATQLTHGPTREQWVARSGSQHFDGLGQRSAHLGRTLALGFGQQQLARGRGLERLGHQRAHLARQAPSTRHERPAAARQVGQERPDGEIRAIDVVDEQQDGTLAEQIPHRRATVLEGARHQAWIIECARHGFEYGG